MSGMDPTAAYIASNEGCKLSPYTDTRGFLTIGYGRNLSANGISQDEAQAMLASDIMNARQVAVQAIGVGTWSVIDGIRKAALTDLAFNMGAATLMEFRHMLDAVRARDWERAADALLNSDYAKELPARSHRNAFMLRTGKFPTAADEAQT